MNKLYAFIFSIPGAGWLKTRLSHVYARLFIGPTEEEKFSHNLTHRLLLTFDDFGDEQQIHSILDILSKFQIKAAFFLVGEWAKKNPNLVSQIRNNGHWVGNHSFSHKKLTSLSEADLKKEILGGGIESALLRPPYGAYNKKIREIAESLGKKICYWSIDSDDWRGLPTRIIADRVLSELHPGACVLMHVNGLHTADALPLIIQGARDRGFEFCFAGNELDV
ncbi:MAG: polysaccharide deacetylase family protein [Candidatus Paceibacterota bacterium]|jgi:peptidoglycan-N-acetylmuramic acid deacetylase|nr:polysaccharide deacetylase family protein [Candidatus Paceibacterota bacterium]